VGEGEGGGGVGKGGVEPVEEASGVGGHGDLLELGRE
jgi:hypothetical protein